MQDRQGALAGRIALVTGGNRGLGLAVAELYAREGAQIVLTARDRAALEAADDRLRAACGASATLVPADLSQADTIERLGAALYERFGRLDILVHCAATLGSLGPVANQDPKHWRRVFTVNLLAGQRLLRSMEPLLKQAEAGRVLVATCAAAIETKPFWGAYGASKAALEQMVRHWGAEIAFTPIRATLIDPGPMATRLRAQAFPGEDPAQLPSPEDAAPAFLPPALPGWTEQSARLSPAAAED